MLDLHIQPVSGAVAVAELDTRHLTRWVLGMQRKGKSAKIIWNCHALISAAMESAVRVGYRSDNPCCGVRLPVPEKVVDAPLTHQSLRSLRERFAELAENAVAFMGSIQRTIDLHNADVEALLAYKEQLIDYLERFINDLLTRGASIADLLGGIPQDGVQFLVTTAAEREALDAAPGEAETALTRAREVWLRHWSGLTNWFVSTPARESESKLLRARARAAIPAPLAVVSSLHEKAGGRTDRTQDFLTLAKWFAELPTNGDRHPASNGRRLKTVDLGECGHREGMHVC